MDNETIPSISYELLKGHGIGFTVADESNTISKSGPWGTTYLSHEANNGGLSNRYMIPFNKTINITCTTRISGPFWYWVHGIYNFPVMYSKYNIELPNNDGMLRLKLYKNEYVLANNLDFITLANITDKPGAVLQFSLYANSSSFTYLEGCLRMKIDDDINYQYLSSGTEDIFDSSYYFDSGIYHSDEVGLTYKSNPGYISAYRFFDSDPILWTNNFELIWRVGETSGINNNNGCPNTWNDALNDNITSNMGNTQGILAKQTTVTTYTWVYEYNL